MNNTQIEAPNTDNETLINSQVNVQEGVGDNSLDVPLAEAIQTSDEKQIWKQLQKE